MNDVEITVDKFTNRMVKIVYTNYRNETSSRNILPIQIYFGATEWHTDQQWLLKAYDIEKDAERCFAIKDIKSWGV